MSRSQLAFLFLPAAVLVTACGGSSADDEPDAAPPEATGIVGHWRELPSPLAPPPVELRELTFGADGHFVNDLDQGGAYSRSETRLRMTYGGDQIGAPGTITFDFDHAILDAQDLLLTYVSRPVGAVDGVVGRWEQVGVVTGELGPSETRSILELRADGSARYLGIIDNVESIPVETRWTLQGDQLTYGDGVNLAITYALVLPGIALSHQTYERLE